MYTHVVLSRFRLLRNGTSRRVSRFENDSLLYDLLMCLYGVERRREERAYIRKRLCTERSTEAQCVSKFLRGVTRREENGGFQKVERTKLTDQSARPFVHLAGRTIHRAERVHRCRVSNIDRTGMHYGVTQEEAVGDYGGYCGTGDGWDRTRCASASLQDRTEGWVIRRRESLAALSRLVSRALYHASLSASRLASLGFVFHFSFRFSAVLFSSGSSCDSDYLLLPTPSVSLYLHPIPAFLPACLPISRLRLTLCQLRTDYRRFTLDRQPFLCLPTLPLPSDPVRSMRSMPKILIGIVCEVDRFLAGPRRAYESTFARCGRPGTRSGLEPNELSIKLSTRYSTNTMLVSPARTAISQRYLPLYLRNAPSLSLSLSFSIVIVNYNMKFRRVNSAPLDTSLYNDPMQ